MGTLLKDVLKPENFDPYASTQGAPIALSAGIIPDDPSAPLDQSAISFVIYGENLRELIRDVLIYWTPERIEQEALRRAGDQPKPAIIAQEVLVFTQIYQAWSDRLYRWISNVAGDGHSWSHRAAFVREQISELLLALERRASSAETRAMDYRLRYEFAQLRSVIAHDKFVSEIRTMIAEAMAADASHDDFKQILASHASAFGRITEELSAVKLDVRFVADRVTQQIADELTGKQRTREIVLGLATNVASGPVADVLHAIGHLF